MALNFGSQLFKGDVEDSLKARWQQSGSTIVNISDGDSGTFTAYTVTAGRTLYVDAIILRFNATADVDIKDNASIILSATGVVDTVLPLYLTTPLKFSHSMVLTVSTGSVSVSATGWEE